MQNKKSFIVSIIIIVLVVAIGAYYFSQKKSTQISQNIPATTSSSNQELTQTTVVNAIATSTNNVQATPVKQKPILQSSSYSDPVWGFSINLPTQWDVTTKLNSASSDKYQVSIHSANDTSNSPDPELLIARADMTRTELSDYSQVQAIKDILTNQGMDAFVNFLVDNTIKNQHNDYNVISTAKKTINGIVFYEIHGNFLGDTSKRPVDDYNFITATPQVFYILNLEGYSDTATWSQQRDAILQSIAPFKFTK